MINQKKVAEHMITIVQELDLNAYFMQFCVDADIINPDELEESVDYIEDNYPLELASITTLNNAINSLRSIINNHKTHSPKVSDDDIKKVFNMLKNRDLHPRGYFDKKCFYLADADLVDVNDPTQRFPYTQMKAGRTLKFVRKMVERYKPDNLEQLISVFNKPNAQQNEG